MKDSEKMFCIKEYMNKYYGGSAYADKETVISDLNRVIKKLQKLENLQNIKPFKLKTRDND